MGLIVGGITERFPDLRFGMLESGGGWIVPFLERLDNRYDIMSKLPEGLKTIPSDYFKRQWWIAFDPEEVTLPLAVDYIGGDRIIWGSDYPHPDAFYPNFLDMLNENITGLPHEVQERIRGPQRGRLLQARRLALDTLVGSGRDFPNGSFPRDR